MKLLLLTTDINIVGGIENVISKLTDFWIEEYNYEIEILSLYGNDKVEPHFDFNKKIKFSFANLNLLKIKNRLGQVTKDFKLKKDILDIIKNKDYDIIMTFHHPISMAVLLNKKHINGKIVVTEHCDYYHGIGRLDRIKRKILYKRADKVVVLTENNKKIYEAFLKNVEVINNPRPFKCKEISNQMNKRIITAGRLEYEKGFDRVIDIFNNPEIINSGWILDIFGDGSQKINLINRIKEYGLENKIRILPFTNNIKDEFLKSDIYILPSRTEAFPMVLMEAMECGLPCVSFDLPGPSEIISKEDGYIIEKNNIGDFQEKLKALIYNERLRKEFSINAKNNVARFDIKNIGEKWNNLYYRI